MFVFSPLVHAQVVVTHANNQQTEVNSHTLRAIFGMRLNEWPDGTPIRVFVLNQSSDAHVKFCKNVLKVFPYQLQRTWNRLVFSGTGQAPIQLDSLEEMKNRIANTPGAIGYLPEDRIDEQIRQLSIQ